MGKPWDLKARTALFAKDVCEFCRRLPQNSEAQEVASQLRKAATSVSANYRAARRGRSDEEFISKIGTVIEEADEVHYWFEHLEALDVQCSNETADGLKQEAHELVAIFVAAHKTAKRNLAKKKAQKRLAR
jgi:four helix bundle protein